MSILACGIVRQFDENEGFGFIVQEDGKVILVERNSIRLVGYKTLHAGEYVTYDLVQNEKGFVAENVRVTWARYLSGR
jgi:CspA family cold shock protein